MALLRHAHARLGAGGLCLLLAATTLASSALLPAPAYAILGIDIPGPADIAEEVFGFILKTFFGISTGVGRRAVEWLVAHPVYTNESRYPELGRLHSYVTAGSWALFSLVVTISSLRYWASGFTSHGSYEALQGLVRAGAGAGMLVAYPQLFEWLCVTGNLLTHALLHAPGVEGGMTKLLAAALVANFATLGIGAIAQVVAVIVLILLVISKVVIATLLALLFVSGGLAIALWPLPETAWLARTWLQTLLAVLLWPVVWALCFALFAVMGKAAFSFEGSFGDELVKPWVTVAALYVAFQAPRLLARQALVAGITPSLGGGVARTLVYGRQAARLASSGAQGVSGRFASPSGAGATAKAVGV